METVTLNITNHPLQGHKVEIVRRDPFKRFVIVRVLKTVGDYRKGTDLHVLPEQIGETWPFPKRNPSDEPVR